MNDSYWKVVSSLSFLNIVLTCEWLYQIMYQKLLQTCLITSEQLKLSYAKYNVNLFSFLFILSLQFYY